MQEVKVKGQAVQKTDNNTESHINNTATKPGVAAQKTAQNNNNNNNNDRLTAFDPGQPG